MQSVISWLAFSGKSRHIYFSSHLGKFDNWIRESEEVCISSDVFTKSVSEWNEPFWKPECNFPGYKYSLKYVKILKKRDIIILKNKFIAVDMELSCVATNSVPAWVSVDKGFQNIDASLMRLVNKWINLASVGKQSSQKLLIIAITESIDYKK